MGALISENTDLYQKSLVWFGKKKEAFSDFISNWVCRLILLVGFYKERAKLNFKV
jgi:hypothetical protein